MNINATVGCSNSFLGDNGRQQRSRRDCSQNLVVGDQLRNKIVNTVLAEVPLFRIYRYMHPMRLKYIFSVDINDMIFNHTISFQTIQNNEP